MRSIGAWSTVLMLAWLAQAGAEELALPLDDASSTSDVAPPGHVGALERVRGWFGGGEREETLSAESAGFSEEIAVPVNMSDKPLLPASSEETPVTAVPEPETVVGPSGEAIVMDPGNPPMMGQTSWVMESSLAPMRRSYGRVDYLYWEAGDPKRVGTLFQLYQVPTTGSPTLSNQIRIDDPNTNHEMGTRAWLGRNLTDVFAIELGGLWVFHSDYIEQEFSQPASTTGTSVTPATVVIIPQTQQQLGEGEMSWRNRYWGTELNGRWHLLDNERWRFDGVVGARYFSYAERMAISYNLTNPSTASAQRTERFETDNNMIGAQLGGDLDLALLEYVSLTTAGRAAIMGNLQDVTVKGPPAGQGLYTNASNLGSWNTSQGTVLLEITPQLNFHLTPNINFMAGYTVIWLNDMMRATEQVDLNHIGGNPVIPFKTDDLLITGFTFSLTCNW